MEFLIVSGLSGAGKSRTSDVLEDLDFYCVDNMPVALIGKFAELCMATRGRFERVALVTDIRESRNFQELFAALDGLWELGCDYKILFVEADVETVVKRYKETRRRHPLAGDTGSIETAVREEMKLLAPVRERADYVINTSNLTLGQLQKELYSLFVGDAMSRAINVNVMSFGFKYGIPLEADLVFDVRFLPNPYYVSELREKTGLTEEVQNFVYNNGDTREFLCLLTDLLSYLMPHYIEEGKHNLTVAVGCTGGRHRSVSIAVALTRFLNEQGYYSVNTNRDIDKG
ncbi:MAG: RNase adapter RapZ [Candidatus Heteroscillospira sp.]|jgi:UPF0042 nucleotide-binding protein